MNTVKDINTIQDNKILAILSEIEDRLKDIYKDKLKQIILYGSFARNEQDKESDIDIMVLVDMEEKEIKLCHDNVLDMIVDLTTDYGIVISVIVNNYKYFYDWINFMPFFTNVSKDGICIYGQ